MLGIHPLNGQGAIIIHTASVPLFDWIWTNRDELLCIHLSQMAYTSTVKLEGANLKIML